MTKSFKGYARLSVFYAKSSSFAGSNGKVGGATLGDKLLPKYKIMLAAVFVVA